MNVYGTRGYDDDLLWEWWSIANHAKCSGMSLDVFAKKYNLNPKTLYNNYSRFFYCQYSKPVFYNDIMAAVELYSSSKHKQHVKDFCSDNDIELSKFQFAMGHASRMRKIKILSLSREIIPLENIDFDLIRDDYFDKKQANIEKKHNKNDIYFSSLAVEEPKKETAQKSLKRHMEISVNDDIKIVFSSHVNTNDLIRMIDLIKEF